MGMYRFVRVLSKLAKIMISFFISIFNNVIIVVLEIYPLFIIFIFNVICFILYLKVEFPDFTQPCYADYSSALGTFSNVEL